MFNHQPTSDFGRLGTVNHRIYSSSPRQEKKKLHAGLMQSSIAYIDSSREVSLF
jgi:hypothetical protein